ncbi:MAG: hypothetical protein KIT83_13675 [Bryobacterales bacterium]|nr:hypothetical protein [Bryobacterales bacterium]
MGETRRQLLTRIGVAAAAASLPRLGGAAEAPPRIEIWYGSRQHFGRLGIPQRWVNVLGAVSPAERIAQVSYALNGEKPVMLSKGPDLYRLAGPGDFNVEIDYKTLKEGENALRIEAKDRHGMVATETVTIVFHPSRRWPLPYEADFRGLKDLEAVTGVTQIVDGKWHLTPDGLRTSDPYYDRVLAFGDMNWTNYSMTAEVRFHAFPGPRQGGPGFGVNHAGIGLRWRGHADDGLQPRVQWHPLGAATEFTLQKDLTQCKWRILPGPPQKAAYAAETFAIDLNRNYWIKGEVTTLADGRNRYRNKIWAVGDPEPSAWAVENHEQPVDDFPSGSALLVAHISEVTFGRVRIEPV